MIQNVVLLVRLPGCDDFAIYHGTTELSSGLVPPSSLSIDQAHASICKAAVYDLIDRCAPVAKNGERVKVRVRINPVDNG